MPVDSTQPGFVEELCVALAHRWEPERLFMLYTAYFDESDTHGPKPDVIMSALLGNARQWRLFERRLRRLQRGYGFTIFHAKDYRARRQEFAGWSDQKCHQLARDLAAAIRDELTDCYHLVLPWDLYQSEYRATPTPKGMPLDSQYGACFRASLASLMEVLRATKQKHRLHVVIEAGHKNVGDTVRIFNDLKDTADAEGFLLLDTITVAKKQGAAPLMAADFQSHIWLVSGRRVRAGLPGYSDIVRENAPKDEAGFQELFFPPNYFPNMKANWERRKIDRMKQWRDARKAKRAAVSSGAEK